MTTSATYDKEYQTPDLFGQPYAELLDFFDNFPDKGTVLDLGCGQGRDCIALAQLGYQVTGFDISQVGIDQMTDNAKRLELSISGRVVDIYDYSFDDHYDAVLLNSMLHFDKKDKEKELGLLKQAADHANTICVCIKRDIRRGKILTDFFINDETTWATLNDTDLDYVYRDGLSGHSSKITYKMLIKKRDTLIT